MPREIGSTRQTYSVLAERGLSCSVCIRINLNNKDNTNNGNRSFVLKFFSTLSLACVSSPLLDYRLVLCYDQFLSHLGRLRYKTSNLSDTVILDNPYLRYD